MTSVIPGVVRVRAATDDELDAAGQVVRDAYQLDGHGSDGYLDTVADARGRARDAVVAVALTPGGTIAGSVTFALPGSPWSELAGPGEAEFRMLGVAPAHRGQGAGAALALWCADRARALGCHRLVISSTAAMTTALRLYQRLGYTRRPDLDRAPLPGVHLIGFSLDLDPVPVSPAGQ